MNIVIIISYYYNNNMLYIIIIHFCYYYSSSNNNNKKPSLSVLPFVGWCNLHNIISVLKIIILYNNNNKTNIKK